MVPSMIRDIKLNCFDGKDENWRSWSAKFLARAHVLGYKEFIEGKLDDKEDPEVYSELNAYAFSDMIINCDGVAFSLVEMSKSGCYPEGDARVAWRQLKERYEAETYATKVQLKREYTRCKLPNGKDPDIWLMELEYMKQRLGKLGSEVEEGDLIAHILSNLGKDYEQLVNVVEGELEGLTFAKLRERIRSFYSRVLRQRMMKTTMRCGIKRKVRKRKIHTCINSKEDAIGVGSMDTRQYNVQRKNKHHVRYAIIIRNQVI